MRIFALETDIEKIKERFCHDGECIVLMTYYHGLSFFFAILREIVITIVLVIAAIVAFAWGWPMVWVLPILFVVWLAFAAFNVIKAYIDWTFDFIFITTDKVILVDQTSIFKQEIMPIHLENIGGISTFTQYMDVFPFGGLSIHLKEGKGGEDVTLKYVPHAKEVSSTISEVVTAYQRRSHSQRHQKLPPEAQQPHYDGSTQFPPQGGELGGGQNGQ
ncbi:MAG: hypothetical protein QF793_03430 [Candidatus Peribacteraceae bacterium]|jgi:hypothetical protein|nr:hypothetical protein [Candidatus Peribacteraceae bacterium]|tara:strand:+ start:193 stop:843 length:651 start_codon:yes stop_codon:yes gene_type:complete